MANAAELEIVKKIYAAINQNNIPAALECIDPQIERVEFEGHPMSGSYHGLAEFSAHLSQARATWGEGSCEPERIVSEGDKIIVHCHVRVRLKNKSEWIDGRVADVFVFRNSKIIQMRSFMTAEEAHAWIQSTSSIS